MLERVALHQTRFRTPGVSPDPRGVLLGQMGAVLFPSLDRFVAFLRAYGEEGSLDELLPSVKIRRVVTPLKTREILFSVAAESSYRMDRISAMAKLAGGLVFTGTARHFVKYRDSSSPLGYDIQDVLSDRADIILYHDSFRQSYAFDRDIRFRDLVMKLEPYRLPPSDFQMPSRLFITAEVGLGRALVGYFFRWQVNGRAALAEWPSESAFEDTSRRLYLMEVVDPPARIVELLRGLPGVHVYEPLGENFGVELGYRHPIALESCQSIFVDEGLTLFSGDGSLISVNPAPSFAPVRSLVRNHLNLEEERAPTALTPEDKLPGFTMSLRLEWSQAPMRNVVASMVSLSEREWLTRMLYALPPKTLSTLKLAFSNAHIYLLDPTGIEGVPLGCFFCEVANRIYVPAGLSIVPAVAPSVLERLVGDRSGGHVFFDRDSGQPRVVSNASFGPVSRQVLRDVAAQVVHADAPDVHDPTLPLLQYEPARRFPLWGVPGKGMEMDEKE